MNAPQSINSPERFVIRALLLWGLALIATGTVYAFLGDIWAYVVLVAGVLTAVAAWWGHRSGNRCQALYSVLFLVGLAFIVVGVSPHTENRRVVLCIAIGKCRIVRADPTDSAAQIFDE